MPAEAPARPGPRASRGFVFAASGAGYTPVAVRAGQSLREVSPQAQIDLFTDAPPEGGHPFDRVHPLDKAWFRPKIEALRRSRFDLTIYLDNDLVFLADITDVFDVLERHDVVAAHSEFRASTWSNATWREALPPAFPQVSSGVMGLRRSDAAMALLDDWENALVADSQAKDQPVLRELLYESRLRLAVLPVEYNMMRLSVIDRFRPGGHAAPRVLHLRRLQEHLRSGGPAKRDLARIVGRVRLARIQALLDADRTLAKRRRRTVSRGFVRRVFRLFSGH